MSISSTRPLNLPKLARILIIGGGGRENALAWLLQGCEGVEKILVAPGNAGTHEISNCETLALNENDGDALVQACQLHEIDLVVIGPEAPLAQGLADLLRKAGLAVFGPGHDGAQLEASKAWSKSVMAAAGVPTARHWAVRSEADALAVLQKQQQPLVVKADGLAAGKGVTVAETIEATESAIREAFQGRFGSAGLQLVLEERLKGPEVSVFALCDGNQFVLLPPAQDHKRLMEGDLGPNTGGMGAYAPAPLLDANGLDQVRRLVIEPTLSELKKRKITYRGVIYAGLMLTESGPKVIEFNCRFGDPECQTLMPLMGPEFAQVLQACALGCLDLALPLTIQEGCSACVVAAASGYPDSPRKGDRLTINIKVDSTLQLFHAGTERNDHGDFITAGGRVLSVVAQGKNFDQAFMRSYEGLQNIEFKGKVFRKDIGYQVRQSKE